MIKYFNSEACFWAELQVYKLALPMLPRLLDYCEPEWIKLERISGQPYLDTDFDPRELAKILAAFHLSSFDGDKCLCHIDNQPRNILAAGKQYYLIDFSDSHSDYPEFDLCHLLLFWAAELPSGVFQDKLKVSIEAYNAMLPLRKVIWKDSILRAIEVFDSRRKRFNKATGKNPPNIIEQNRKLLFTCFDF